MIRHNRNFSHSYRIPGILETFRLEKSDCFWIYSELFQQFCCHLTKFGPDKMNFVRREKNSSRNSLIEATEKSLEPVEPDINVMNKYLILTVITNSAITFVSLIFFAKIIAFNKFQLYSFGQMFPLIPNIECQNFKKCLCKMYLPNYNSMWLLYIGRVPL